MAGSNAEIERVPCSLCGEKVRDTKEERNRHISNNHQKEIDSAIECHLTTHYCPSRKCRQLVHLEDDFCPHCGRDLAKWREQWAIGLLAFASFTKGMGTSWITGYPKTSKSKVEKTIYTLQNRR